MTIPSIDCDFERERARWSVALAGLKVATTGIFEDGPTRLMTFVAGASDQLYVGYIGLVGTSSGLQCRFGALDPVPDELSLEELARDVAASLLRNDLKAFFIAAADIVKSRRRHRPDQVRLLDDFLDNIDLLAMRAHYSVRETSRDDDYDEVDSYDDPIESLSSYDEFHALGESQRSLIRDWPWMLKGACRTGALLPASDGEDPARYAARVLVDICRPAGQAPVGGDFQQRLAAVLKLVRGRDLAFTFGTFDDGVMIGLLGLADMPPEWIPTRLDEATEDEWCAAIPTGEQTYRLARLMDRRPRSFIKTFPGSWEELQREIAEAADIFDPAANVAYGSLVGHCSEMLSSFENNVLLPAFRRTGADAGEHTSFDTLAGDECPPSGAKGSIREISAKFLLRDKGWRAIAETSAVWSARTHAIATVEARLSDHATWNVPFDMVTVDTPDGPIEIMALASAQDLLDEGVRGPDSHGIEGMAHCVPSYMTECAIGQSIVVSVRRKDAGGKIERLSTAQLRVVVGGYDVDKNAFHKLEVIQHYARGNSAPSLVARQALATFISGAKVPEIARSMMANINYNVPSAFYDPTRPGSVEAMLAVWDFALSRDLRKLSVDDFAEHALSLATKMVSSEERGPDGQYPRLG